MDLADLVAAALAEDLGERGDVTSLVTIPEGARARGHGRHPGSSRAT